MTSGAVGPVRVTRNGNSRTLTIPAKIASAAAIEPGDQFMVEVVDGALVYRPVEISGPADRDHEYVPGGPRGYFVGEGKERYFQLYRGAAIIAGPDPVERLPIDWDF
jgi:antitoxin component of MazEF toxin-antitoxin module